MVLVTDKARQAHSQAGALRAGKFNLPDGTWEFTSRKADRGGEVYARYLGTKKNATGETAA